MNELETNCYNFLINLAQTLAADFETQFSDMEEFARWNLPEEIAMEWIDAEGMLQILKNAHCGVDEALDVFENIIHNFNVAYEHSLDHVWTHYAMQTDDFWLQQRRLAQQALKICSSV